MSKTFPYTYIKGRTTRTKDAKVPIQCKAIQYGLGCFTGIRGFWHKKKKNLYLFRLEDHYKRLKNSSKLLGMKFDYTYPEFREIIFKLVKRNKVKEDLYIRPTLYAASTLLTPRFDNPDDDLAIYMISLKNYFKADRGLNVCISSWTRFSDDIIPTKAKSTGAYANGALAKTEALRKGFDEPIFLDAKGNVCEASGANIFGIKNGVIWTPPTTASILNGITRDSLIKLARKELKLKVEEKNFKKEKLFQFDELFLSGTAAKITPVASVDKKKIGNASLGPITAQLKTLYDKAVMTDLKGYEKWCTSIY
ncbi:MAG: branched-chain amino acid transaminase [bacterium]|nr:branched-chain amino acid transaminase [bacterium]